MSHSMSSHMLASPTAKAGIAVPSVSQQRSPLRLSKARSNTLIMYASLRGGLSVGPDRKRGKCKQCQLSLITNRSRETPGTMLIVGL